MIFNVFSKMHKMHTEETAVGVSTFYRPFASQWLLNRLERKGARVMAPDRADEELQDLEIRQLQKFL